MSIRKEIHKTVRVDHGGRRNMEDVTVYASTKEEAARVDTGNLLIGSTLIVVGSAEVYMLDADGGDWRTVSDGSRLS